MADDTSLVTAATFTKRHEAEIGWAALRSAGIEALVIADDEGGLNPGFFAEYAIRLVVRDKDLADARAVLEPAP